MSNILIDLGRDDGRRSFSKLDEKLFKQDYALCLIWERLLSLQHRATYYNKQEYFKFTYEFIEKQFNVTNYKVRYCIQTLVASGLLEVKHIGNPSRIHYKINCKQYTILLEELYNTNKSSINSTEVETAVCTEVEINLHNKESKSKSKDLESKDVASKEAIVTDVTGSRLLRRSLLRQGTEQTLSKGPVVEPTIKDINKPKLVRRKPSLFPSKEVESLYLHWNSKQGLTTHSLDPNKTIFVSSVKQLVKHLKKYKLEQIKQAIDDYYLMLLDEDCIPDINFQWSKSSLASFFEGFSSYQKEAFSNQDCMGGVDSWFDECIKGYDYLKVKFGKPVKAIKCKNDNHQEVSKQIAVLYRNKIKDSTFTDFEMNMIIDAAEDLVNFHFNMKNKIHWSSCVHEKDSVKSFVHHLIDALSEMSDDKSKIQVSWLRGKMFSERLPLWLKKIGMLDSEQSMTGSSLMSEENQVKRKIESDAAGIVFKAECRKVHESGLSPEAQAPLLKKLQDGIIKFREDLIIKYGGTVTKVVEEKKSSNDWMYDSE